MNFEKYHNIADPIKTENRAERADILRAKIEKLSLIYSEHKFQTIKQTQADYQFSQAIKDFSPIETSILRDIYRLDNFDQGKYQGAIDDYLLNTYQEIDRLHESTDFDLDRLYDYIRLKSQSAISSLGLEVLKQERWNLKKKLNQN